MPELNLTQQGRLQVSAFHALYKCLRRAEKPRSRLEDFVEAIVKTSDEAMANTDPELVRQWCEEFDHKGARGKKEPDNAEMC